VNFHYGVNACVGRRVVAYGEPGTIVKDLGHYIGVVLDSAPHSSPGRYHPIDGIVYGEVVDYEPPKMNARKYAAKRNYQEFRMPTAVMTFTNGWASISLVWIMTTMAIAACTVSETTAM
jgi:hypothetical protein